MIVPHYISENQSDMRGIPNPQMRKQFEIVSAQNKELCALAQEIATEAAEPIKTGVAKALRNFRPTTNSFRNTVSFINPPDL